MTYCAFMRHCLVDYSQDHAELGAALNGFSLNETGPLASAIEKTGQAVDGTYMLTTRMVSQIINSTLRIGVLTLNGPASRARTELGGTIT